MNIAIDIPDEIGLVFAAHAGGAARVVLEAAAVEWYRAGTVTQLQVQQMLGLRSLWETESFLHRAGAVHDYTLEDLDKDIAAIRTAPK